VCARGSIAISIAKMQKQNVRAAMAYAPSAEARACRDMPLSPPVARGRARGSAGRRGEVSAKRVMRRVRQENNTKYVKAQGDRNKWGEG